MDCTESCKQFLSLGFTLHALILCFTFLFLCCVCLYCWANAWDDKIDWFLLHYLFFSIRQARRRREVITFPYHLLNSDLNVSILCLCVTRLDTFINLCLQIPKLCLLRVMYTFI